MGDFGLIVREKECQVFAGSLNLLRRQLRPALRCLIGHVQAGEQLAVVPVHLIVNVSTHGSVSPSGCPSLWKKASRAWFAFSRTSSALRRRTPAASPGGS